MYLTTRPAQYLMTGNKPSAALEYPSIGSLAANLSPASAGIPPYFTIGEAANTGAGFLGAAYDPFRFLSAAGAAAKDLNGVVLPASMNREQLERRRRMQVAFNARFMRDRRRPIWFPRCPSFNKIRTTSWPRTASAMHSIWPPNRTRPSCGTARATWGKVRL